MTDNIDNSLNVAIFIVWISGEALAFLYEVVGEKRSSYKFPNHEHLAHVRIIFGYLEIQYTYCNS